MLELHLASKKKVNGPFTTIADTADNGTKVGTYGVDFSTGNALTPGHTSNDAGTVIFSTYSDYGLLRTPTGYHLGKVRPGPYYGNIVNRTGEYILNNGGVRKYNTANGKWDKFVASVAIDGYGYGCGSPDGTLWTKRRGDNSQINTTFVETRTGNVSTVDALHSLVCTDNKRVLFGRRGDIRRYYDGTITNTTAYMRLYTVPASGVGVTIKSFTDRTGHFAADGDFNQLFEYRFTNNTWYAYTGTDDFTTTLSTEFTSGLPDMSKNAMRGVWFTLSADGKTMLILRDYVITVYRRPSTTTGGWVLVKTLNDAYSDYHAYNCWPSVNTDGTVVFSPYANMSTGIKVYHIL